MILYRALIKLAVPDGVKAVHFYHMLSRVKQAEHGKMGIKLLLTLGDDGSIKQRLCNDRRRKALME
jgi:hypothetical protein